MSLFPKHQKKGRGQVMMASHAVMEVERDEASNLRAS